MQLVTQLPTYLRQYVVEQDYAAYTAEDQAVWRFVLLQTYARHLRSAHAAYAEGFAAVGISVEEIPRITRMNERLAACGFQAVCVDGFIPPRAFQAFQARGFLPIAADIRTSQHLTYTPAPDIIHEAAGHAPFLADAQYASFLRAIGQAGERAFTTPYDADVYDAIHSLSELKEDPGASDAMIAAAEGRLKQLTAAAPAPSEAALLSRLYWWTVEYGLVGDLKDYRIYGAGLLSSIGEGHFCHAPNVKKLPLGAACVDVGYDITRPQPQLFVARDFEHLREVLDEVCDRFAFRIGGVHALEQARASAEPATLELCDGLQLAGVVTDLLFEDTQPAAVTLCHGGVWAQRDVVMSGAQRLPGCILALGHLEDGTSLSKLATDKLRVLRDKRGKLCLRTQHGLVIEGSLQGHEAHAGHATTLWLRDFTLTHGGRRVCDATASLEPFPLLLAERVFTAHAALPEGYYPPTVQPATKVPKPRVFTEHHARLLSLYEEALGALRRPEPPQIVRTFARIHQTLQTDFPDDWLLRWNLLESLAKLGTGAELTATLTQELEALELRYSHREPIATGLGYVRTLYKRDPP